MIFIAKFNHNYIIHKLWSEIIKFLCCEKHNIVPSKGLADQWCEDGDVWMDCAGECTAQWCVCVHVLAVWVCVVYCVSVCCVCVHCVLGSVCMCM